MDALVTTCLACGEPLKEPRKLKDFCSYSCRGRHAVSALDGPRYQSAVVGSKNTRKTKALQSLRKRSVGRFIFAKINSCAYRVDAPTKKAAGWLMEIAWPGGTRQRWVARIGNQASESLSLEEAKQAATAMLCKPEKAEARDWIAELNQTAATEVDRAVIERQRRQWPLNVMGANNRQAPRIKVDAKAVLETERVLIDDEPVTPGALQGDDYPLEYYEDGYPKLPACLDRRTRPAMAEAA